jgi:predicted MPP superfamily phosphohydrolase
MGVYRRTASREVSAVTVLSALFQRLEVGAQKPLLVRREKVARIGVKMRILFASDLHLRKHGPPHIIDGLVGIATKECPDVVLLGGDLVDWTTGLDALQSLVRRLSGVAPVGAVAGNHDRWIGVAKVQAAVLAAGGRWLEDSPWTLGADCAIYGSREQPVQAANYHLLCTHHPGASALSPGRHFDLTLSGHLHGGQLVLYQRNGKLYPGAFLYRWNGLRFEDNDGKTLLISRGVQDTLPLRWNCPREVLVVDIGHAETACGVRPVNALK